MNKQSVTKCINFPTAPKRQPRRPPEERDLGQNPYQPRPPDEMLDLPDRPRTGSPVPWLTSIHATNGRGRYPFTPHPHTGRDSPAG